MIEIGKQQMLTYSRETPSGYYLSDGHGIELLLPGSELKKAPNQGESLLVFVYRDSSDRLICSLKNPLISLNSFAVLACADVTDVGAFMDWGLDKHLLVPFREQANRMTPGRRYIVYMYLDEKTGRLVASSKINRFLDNSKCKLQSGDKVELLIADTTDLGYNVIINQSYRGLIYSNEVFKPLQYGLHTVGYIKNVRPDGKIDVSLQPGGYKKNVDPASGQILDKLRAAGGFLPFHDGTDPEVIYREFGMSKKTFKKAVGMLYRQRQIQLSDRGITLSEED